jgi:hypothetical protein
MNSGEMSAPAAADLSQGQEALGDKTWELAATLAQPQDLDAAIRGFDTGQNLFGDISMLTAESRATVLAVSGENRPWANQTEATTFYRTAGSLCYAMSPDAFTRGLVLPNPGVLFLERASQDLELGLPGAVRLDGILATEHGLGLSGLARTFADDPNRAPLADRLVGHTAANPTNTYAIAQYLAERSLSGEQQMEQYGSMLVEAKVQTMQQLERLAAITGLRPEYVERARMQVFRAGFGSKDNVRGLQLTRGSTQPGSLRMDVNWSPEEAALTPMKPRKTVFHELQHISAAQVMGARIGLAMGEHGLGSDTDEALTDFLTQMNFGLPGNDTERVFLEESPYPYETLAMYDVWTHNLPAFATLFNAYYGQVDDVVSLQASLLSYHDSFARYARPVDYEKRFGTGALLERAANL